MRWSRVLPILALSLASSITAAQSDGYQAPVLRPAPAGADLFTEKQEMDLAALRHRAKLRTRRIECKSTGSMACGVADCNLTERWLRRTDD